MRENKKGLFFIWVSQTISITGISFMILVSIVAYMGIFLFPAKPIEGISPEMQRSMMTIGYWILSQAIWQAISQFTNITFGIAFQAGLLGLVGAIVSTHLKLGYVQLTLQTTALFAAIVIALALLDNLPRMFTHHKNTVQEDKPKRNIYNDETPDTNRLEEPDNHEQNDYLHKVDALIFGGKR